MDLQLISKARKQVQICEKFIHNGEEFFIDDYDEQGFSVSKVDDEGDQQYFHYCELTIQDQFK
jgi:hypothetical protein